MEAEEWKDSVGSGTCKCMCVERGDREVKS